jgi:hypothetical protein
VELQVAHILLLEVEAGLEQLGAQHHQLVVWGLVEMEFIRFLGLGTILDWLVCLDLPTQAWLLWKVMVITSLLVEEQDLLTQQQMLLYLEARGGVGKVLIHRTILEHMFQLQEDQTLAVGGVGGLLDLPAHHLTENPAAPA